MNFLNLAKPVVSYLMQDNEYEQQKKALREQYELMGDLYRRQSEAATSAFNRRYYRNYLDNAGARNMLKSVREQLGEQAKALRNRSVVTGATGEAAAAVQKNNARVLDSMTGTIAAAGENARMRAEDAYAADRNRLDTFMMNATAGYHSGLNNLEARQRRNTASLFMNGVYDKLQRFVGLLGDNAANNGKTGTGNAAAATEGGVWW